LIEVLSFYQVSESAFANLLIKDSLLLLKVVISIPHRLWHELFALLNDLLKFLEALRSLDFLHGLALERPNFLSDLGEEVLYKDSGSLSHQLLVDSLYTIHSLVVLAECTIEFTSQLLANQCDELHSLQLLREYACVADYLSCIFNISHINLIALLAKLRPNHLPLLHNPLHPLQILLPYHLLHFLLLSLLLLGHLFQLCQSLVL